MPADWRVQHVRFPTTRWSLVDRAGAQGPEAMREALEQLLAAYLPALRTHLVYGKRVHPDDADDVLQEFVAGKILQRDLLARADQELGKFRTFLLTALDRFLLNSLRDRSARKRAAGAAAAVLGDQAGQLAAEPTEDAFEQAWARQVIGQAVERMRAECEASGRRDVWGLFECRVLAPTLHGAAPADYAELVERFGFSSPSQASNVLVTAKRMYARTLRAVVAEYACDAAEVESEIDELHRVLARAR